MFNIGFAELIILGIIGILVVGPEQLPDLARKIAKMVNELKRAKDELLEPVDELKNEAQAALDKLRRDANEQITKQNDEMLKMKAQLEKLAENKINSDTGSSNDQNS